jgi:hypothetical protein
MNPHVSTRGHWTLEWPGRQGLPSKRQQTAGDDPTAGYAYRDARPPRSERHYQGRRKCDQYKDSNRSPITANVVSADCPIPVPFRSPW